MHLIRCFAVGGFKINGPPRIGKGPMTSKEVSDTSNEASLPKPTQAGRIETCTELISKAMKCLGNGDKDCVTKLIEELVKANCHNGYAVGREIADKVRDVVHELWLVSDNECRCELLKILKELGITKKWVRNAVRTSPRYLNEYLLIRCRISWENRTTRYEVIKNAEDILRRIGWDEIRMCEELWRFVGVDVNVFRRYGIEPCVWLSDLELLGDLRRPYWFGMAETDLTIMIRGGSIRLALSTTNTIDAVFFVKLLDTVKVSLVIGWKRTNLPAIKYADKLISLDYYVNLSTDKWSWPIKLSADELERIIKGFTDEELAEFVGGAIDGDGSVRYVESVYVGIMVCKNCPKRAILDVLKEVIAKRFGIIGDIYHYESEDALEFHGENAVKLLRRVAKYMHHPLRRLRAELILALYDGRISLEEIERLYEQTEYERGAPDVKRNHALEALVRAAPQTHTHGVWVGLSD
ncbi:hypothetical protein [Vulcanisaeta sp. EB80]|uniref:hypothetical protein n=1 Tax=Vulcanisaeta sp. EB80 TaxID=1650660 RepID=UPI00117CFBE2|nr:hypothetical protein [Vulcanisaeta sp. EB80]